MLRRTPLFSAISPQVVGSGLQPDLHPLIGGLWARAANVAFINGKIRRKLPASAIVTIDAGGPVRGLSQHQDSAGVRWVWAAANGEVKRWYGPAAESILAAQSWKVNQSSLYQATFWDFTHYGDWTLINSGIGAAQLFKPGVGAAPIADAPVDVLQFTKKLNFLVAIGYGANGKRIGWSDADNVETWTAMADNLAGALTIEELDTPIRATSIIGSNISIYGEDQLAFFNYIGAPFYFGQKVAVDGIGAVGKMSVASDGTSNFGVGRGGCWWTDGIGYKYIDEGFIREYFQEEVNWDQGSKIVVQRNDYTGCMEFFFPMRESLEVNEGWSFDPRVGSWGPIPSATSKVSRKLFAKPLAGKTDGVVYLDENDGTLAGPLDLQSKPMLMQMQSPHGLTDAHTISRIDEILLLVKSAANVEFRLGASETSDGVPNYSTWQPVQNESDTYTLSSGLTDGVYYLLEFRSTATDWDLNLQGFLLYGNIEGASRVTA